MKIVHTLILSFLICCMFVMGAAFHPLAERPGAAAEGGEEELKALLSPSKITEFLKGKAEELVEGVASDGLDWVSSLFFNAIGFGQESEFEQIEKQLEEIIKLDKEILSKLDDLKTEVEFQGLLTQSFPSVERINTKYDQLLKFARAPEEVTHTDVKRLTEAILDPNLGVAYDLKAIHDVLVGTNVMNPDERGALELFMVRWKGAFYPNQFDPETPTLEFKTRSYQYFHALVMMQYKGILLLANVYIKEKKYSTLKNEIEELVTRLNQQQKIMDDLLPTWIQDVPAHYLTGTPCIISLKSDKNKVFYANPPFIGFKSGAVFFRGRHAGNGDEEWFLEPAGKSDLFYLRKRGTDGNNKGKVSYVKAHDQAPFFAMPKDVYPALPLLAFRFIILPDNSMGLGVVNPEGKSGGYVYNEYKASYLSDYTKATPLEIRKLD
jgi:hypothetical protein